MSNIINNKFILEQFFKYFNINYLRSTYLLI